MDLDTLNQDIIDAGPGGTVELSGEYTRTKPLLITQGGEPDNPVTIRGGSFFSNRTDPWVPGSVNGVTFFQLGPGADWITFADSVFTDVGICYQIGAPLQGVTLEGFHADNVQRYLDNRILSGQADATLTDLTVREGIVNRFSKGVVKLQYDTHNVLIEGVTGDSNVDGDNFAMGVQFAGTVHDVTCDNVHMHNCVQTRAADLYWNGDGFVSEELTRYLSFRFCSSVGCTDAGWDLKGNDHILASCTAVDNKRNFRLWGRAIMNDTMGFDPYLRGGIGTQAQVHATDQAVIDIMGGRFEDCDPNTIVFDADQSGIINVHTAFIKRAGGSALYTTETNSQVNIAQPVTPVTDTFCP